MKLYYKSLNLRSAEDSSSLLKLLDCIPILPNVTVMSHLIQL